MDETERSETVDLDGDRWIALDFSREWPKYVVTWSIRRRAGDGDFPEQAGRFEHMPPRGEQTIDDVYDELRASAVQAAQAAAEEAPVSTDRPSFLGRVFGRRDS